MKHFILLLLFSLVLQAGHTQTVSCDLGFFNNCFKRINGTYVDANNLSTGSIAKVQTTIANFSPVAAPAGHFKVVIRLGPGLILNPPFNIATAPLSNYFNWTYNATDPMQPTIIGNSIADLPANFVGIFYFEFRAITLAAASVSFDLLTTNPSGTTTPIVDPNVVNNSAGNPHSINGILLPVNFAGITAATKDCSVSVNWNVKTEDNLSRYEVEVSKDGINFSTVAEVTDLNRGNYSAGFAITDVLQAPFFYVRVKAVDKDGKSMYSSIATTKGQCKQGEELAVLLYPNPVQVADFITLRATNGVFNGKYSVSLVDRSGKVYDRTDVVLKNLTQFRFSLSKIASGSYSIIMKGDTDAHSIVVNFTKL